MGDDNHKDQKSFSYEKSTKSSSSYSLWSLMVTIVILIFLSYIFFSFNFTSFRKPYSISRIAISPVFQRGRSNTRSVRNRNRNRNPEETTIKHIVFGIAASSDLWKHRREYVKAWWKPTMKGAVWLDKHVNSTSLSSSSFLPKIKISSDTSSFKYKNRYGHRSAIRITRIVSETVRMLNGTKDERNVRWLVMGDDDTVFFPDNLVRILRKYDHNQFYYIGAPSESHLQNLEQFSYGMAYGGGGFAISYPLAKVLEKMQDRCIESYPGLYGSDDRIHVCMAELGVPLTREAGFHQFDVYGNLLGLLSAHPQTPIVSIHHLDFVDPIFPNMGRLNAINRLMIPAKLDSASLVQQSICYDASHHWTVSVSWGYTAQIIRSYLPARMMETPIRTFEDWYKRGDFNTMAFNTRPISYTPCQIPRVYYMSHVLYDSSSNKTLTKYVRLNDSYPKCDWGLRNPSDIKRILVYKKPDPNRWNKAPRRDCCRVLSTDKKGTMVVDVGTCHDGEVVAYSE